ncbi:hypothetical protein J0H58_16320 [bacterium]|nr:hypothetical protein [bacterium]
MDCRDAQFYLRLRHPGRDEFEPEVSAALDRHVAGCPACAAADRALGGFDKAVATAMRAVPVPDGLRDRLFADAAARRGVLLRRKTYRLAAAAASVLVVAGLFLGWYSASRPQPDTDALVMAGDELVNPLGGQKTVDQFLKSERLPALPEKFDPTLLVHTGTARVQGRDVPVLVYRTATGWAKVYAFRSTSFDTKTVRDAQQSHCTARAYPVRDGVAYVVVFTGIDLNPFLLGGGPIAMQT